MGYDNDERQYMEQLYEGMVTQSSTFFEGMITPGALAIANKIVRAVQRWGGVTVGAKPLAKELNLPESHVLKILNVMAKQGVLQPVNAPRGVFTINQRLMKDVEGMLISGKLKFARTHSSGEWSLTPPDYDPFADPSSSGSWKRSIR